VAGHKISGENKRLPAVAIFDPISYNLRAFDLAVPAISSISANQRDLPAEVQRVIQRYINTKEQKQHHGNRNSKVV
jgi:hypothetical protein